MYHSTAMLLPDGRVVSAGGNNTPTAQIFKPPYLTSGAPRPTIVTAPAYVQYGQQFSVTYNGPSIDKVALIRLAAVTHGFDQDQRYVPLEFEDDNSQVLPAILARAPANGNIAPPGFYMLFILNEYTRNQYAPCTMAAYVQVGP
jgi:hypothetical protein